MAPFLNAKVLFLAAALAPFLAAISTRPSCERSRGDALIRVSDDRTSFGTRSGARCRSAALHRQSPANRLASRSSRSRHVKLSGRYHTNVPGTARSISGRRVAILVVRGENGTGYRGSPEISILPVRCQLLATKRWLFLAKNALITLNTESLKPPILLL